MGKGQPSSDDDDIEGGPINHSSSHDRHQNPPPQYFSPPGPKEWFAWLVPLIFVANLVMFGVTMYVNNCPENTGAKSCVLYDFLGRFSFEPQDENSLFGPSSKTLEKLGALEWARVVEEREVWRLISCIWLHAGVIHLLSNMLSLLLIAIRMEQEFGFWRIGLLYIFSGFGGSLMSALAHVGKAAPVSVGASGALFGLMGGMLSELFTNWSNYANKCGTLFILLFVISLNLALGFVPQVDNSAHIGGFLSGFLVGFILLMRPQYGYVSSKNIPAGYEIKGKKPKHKCYQHVFWVIALVLLIAGYAYGLTMLFKGSHSDPLGSFALDNWS